MADNQVRAQSRAMDAEARRARLTRRAPAPFAPLPQDWNTVSFSKRPSKPPSATGANKAAYNQALREGGVVEATRKCERAARGWVEGGSAAARGGAGEDRRGAGWVHPPPSELGSCTELPPRGWRSWMSHWRRSRLASRSARCPPRASGPARAGAPVSALTRAAPAPLPRALPQSRAGRTPRPAEEARASTLPGSTRRRRSSNVGPCPTAAARPRGRGLAPSAPPAAQPERALPAPLPAPLRRLCGLQTPRWTST